MKSEVNAKQSKLKKNIPLYVLLLPSIILLILFAYIPMAGLVIAFKDYSPATGILPIWDNHEEYLENFYLQYSGWFSLADCSSHYLQPDSCGQVQKNLSSNDLFASFYLDHGHVWDDYSLSLSK